MSITVQTMKPKLLTLHQAREALSRTEPLTSHDFSIGPGVRFSVAPNWEIGLEALEGTERANAHIHIGGSTIPLTKDALLEATSICGLGKPYAQRCPSILLEPQLNYWFQCGLVGRPIRDYQVLVAGGLGAAVTRASIKPFSNLRLLDQALDGIEDRYGGGEVLVDYKFVNSLRRTHMRLIVPEYVRAITGSGVSDDTWSVGLQIKNSLIGETQTSIDGYLFRWSCTNGAIDTQSSSSGVWCRRGDAAAVYDWAKTAVDEILGGLEGSLDAVQAMVGIRIQGAASDVLRDVFTHYKVPDAERNLIIDRLLDAEGELTMYNIMAAVTEVANDAQMEPSHIEALLRMGGDLPHAASSVCDACRRMLPH